MLHNGENKALAAFSLLVAVVVCCCLEWRGGKKKYPQVTLFVGMSLSPRTFVVCIVFDKLGYVSEPLQSR